MRIVYLFACANARCEWVLTSVVACANARCEWVLTSVVGEEDADDGSGDAVQHVKVFVPVVERRLVIHHRHRQLQHHRDRRLKQQRFSVFLSCHINLLPDSVTLHHLTMCDGTDLSALAAPGQPVYWTGCPGCTSIAPMWRSWGLPHGR